MCPVFCLVLLLLLPLLNPSQVLILGIAQVDLVGRWEAVGWGQNSHKFLLPVSPAALSPFPGTNHQSEKCLLVSPSALLRAINKASALQALCCSCDISQQSGAPKAREGRDTWPDSVSYGLREAH